MAHAAGDDENYDTSEEGTRGSGDITAPFRDKPDPETIEEIEAERERRLDPENRPPNAEVDNSDRTFNSETGHFED